MNITKVTRHPVIDMPLSRSIVERQPLPEGEPIDARSWAQVLFDLDKATDGQIGYDRAFDLARQNMDGVYLSLVDIPVQLTQGSSSDTTPHRFTGCGALHPFRSNTFMPSPRLYEGLSPIFCLPNELFFSDATPGEEIIIDFGDGKGRRPVALGSEIFADLHARSYFELLNNALNNIRLDESLPRSIILITYTDYTAPIQANAQLVFNFLEGFVNETGFRNHAFGGVSMGALVMRFALAKWENEHRDELATIGSYYFSWDGPQFCACIPLSVQWQAQFWASESCEAEEVAKLLTSPAATQMLFYMVRHASKSHKVWNQDRELFFNELNDLTPAGRKQGYPRNMILLGVANGRNGTSLPLYGPGKNGVSVKLIKVDFISIAHTFANQDVVLSSHSKKLAFGEAWCTKLGKKVSVNCAIGLTLTSGGWSKSFQELGANLISGFDEHGKVQDKDQKITSDYHSFVPTFSALDIEVPAMDPYVELGKTPCTAFDCIQWASENTEHATVFDEGQKWLFDHIQGRTAPSSSITDSTDQDPIDRSGFASDACSAELIIKNILPASMPE